MNDKNKRQEAGDNSELYQAENIVVNNGLTFSEAKELVIMVMQENFIKFSREAMDLARARVEEITTDYLNELNTRDPSLIEAVKDPGIQMSLLAAETQYVKTGDREIADLLVRVLVERTAQTERTMLQITLDESLIAIGKLTNQHISIVMLSFLLNRIRHGGINSTENLKQLFDNYIKPLVAKASRNRATYQHVSDSNCGNLLVNNHFADTLLANHKGIFNKGFDKGLIHFQFGREDVFDDPKFASVIIPSPQPNPFSTVIKGEWYVNALNDDVIKNYTRTLSLNVEQSQNLQRLFDLTIMNSVEVKNHLLVFGDYMKDLIILWDQTALSELQLNNIGVAIAIAALKKEFNTKLDYSAWINDN